MKNAVNAVLVIALMFCSAAPLQADTPGDSYTLLISIDGFGYNTFQKWRQRAPNLSKLARTGVYGPSRTIFPSMTWPSHASIATGTYPKKHGILGNRVLYRHKKRVVHSSLIEASGAFRVPTIWDIAFDKGLSTAAIMWPSTQKSKKLHWNIPEVYGQKSYKKGSSPGFLKKLKDLGFPTNHLGRFSKRQLFTQDSMVRDIAVHLVETKQPKLHLVHFLSMDSLGHSYGLNAPEVRWGLELVDRYVGDLIKAYKQAGIYKKTNVFIVSDHGFLTYKKRVDADRLLHNNGFIKTLKKLKRGPVRTVSNGHALYIYIYDGKRRHTIRNEIVELFRGPEVGSNIKKILRPKHFAKYHLPTTRTHKNAPDLIIVSKPHVVFGRLGGKKLVSSTKPRGMHGYFPSHPDLWPLFIASGPAVKTSTNPVQMRNIDVAPTLLKTMGLQLPGPIDGQVKTEILKP